MPQTDARQQACLSSNWDRSKLPLLDQLASVRTILDGHRTVAEGARSVNADA